MKQVGVFHPGTQHSWHTAHAFHEANRLAWYTTSIFYRPQAPLYRQLSKLPGAIRTPLERELMRRSFPPLNDAKVVEFGGLELAEILARRLKWRTIEQACNAAGNAQFERNVSSLARKTKAPVVLGYNTSSRAVFENTDSGVLKVLDQTIGHPQAEHEALLAEYEKGPAFFHTRPDKQQGKWLEDQLVEHDRADLILAGSDFCANTLIAKGVPASKIQVVGYGYDGRLHTTVSGERTAGAPLRCLFAGTLAARKGARYLLEAFAGIPASLATLTVLGRVDIPDKVRALYQDNLTLIAQRPKHEVAELMSNYDVIVLPTLFEGSALVLYEGIGSGLALIHTAASGHPDYGNGVQLADLDVEGLRETIVALAEDPDRLAGYKARSRALRSGLTWDGYRSRLRAVIDAADQH